MYLNPIWNLAASKLLLQIVNGQQIQFVVRYKSEKLEQIVSFAKPMEDANLSTLNACMAGIGDRLSASVKDKWTRDTRHATAPDLVSDAQWRRSCPRWRASQISWLTSAWG